jgi:hypothetical protein
LRIKEKEMTKKILIAGFACWSVLAVAQASGSQDQAASAAQTKDQHPKEVASGQASGKRQYQPVVIMKVQDKATPAAIEQQSPKATGKVNQDGAADRENPTTSQPKGTQARVATGDVNGDGKADVARVAKGDVNGDGKADAAINNSHSNIKNTRDAASGLASGGKRQHADNTVNKEADAAPKQ